MKKIVIAGGCFWGVEAYFSRLKGVISTEVGYSNGSVRETNYEEVCKGTTEHAEVCEINYDNRLISLDTILEHLFRFIDPTALNKQGGDTGIQYRTGVYYYDIEDREIALHFLEKQKERYQDEIVVEVDEVQNFCKAEDYHQNYLVKNPTGYCHVNLGLLKPNEMK
ncbi:peptide-methionine (S)-S-oxide reductase MsrA [Haloplasma contractile]|uniref:Peptide methionine sulfoxide reductase MsrA n=1 Tax=Haloplasma contractile SSD-17B TaxID=1033810 RepID=F7Q0G1_9MOLU|nr:peptide-methionine (S)-S-oxide reductase MsrA [Haloplasma contractile]ERJ12693.1 PEPTIDE METHIONINE SULFOXIDE REDUCTASE protein [Haloplasma contractile SSD-17B]